MALASFQLTCYAQTDKALVDLADEMYEFGDYEDAIGLYLQAVNENPKNIRANYQLGECYLRTSHSKPKAVNFYLKAYDLDAEYTNMILFKVAESYRFAHQFDKAIEYYKLFGEEVEIQRRMFEGLDTYELKKVSNRKILECSNAKKYIASPTSVQIKNLGDEINSAENDYAPVLSSDGNMLIFTSRRAGGIGLLKDVDNKYFEDIWISNFDGKKWSKPENIGPKINSENHESNLCLSPIDEHLYIYKTENAGDIFLAKRVYDEWEEPVSLGEPINTKYKESSAFETSDGKRLFFSSDRPGGQGNIDLYVSKKNDDGKWGEPTNLGSVVNSEYDEEGPFFVLESNTLYFSSKGHNGMGGYDLYKSVFNPSDNSWTKPQNLGYPINSTDDDLYFTMASDGKTGYYASFKEDSRGENDLYSIYPADQSVVEDTDSAEVVNNAGTASGAVVLKFSVYDYDTQKPIDAHIELVDKDTDEKLFNGKVNGEFVFSFNNIEPKLVILLVESDGYLFQTVKIKVPGLAKDKVVLERKLGMKKPKENVANIMRNVYFDFNKATLKKESYNEIEKLVKMLNANPTMRIEIIGHTDFIGGSAYNKELSRQRASAVRDYIVSRKIAANRVTAVGYGSERPLASNDDEEEGRELNRRTEFTILSK